MSTMKRAQQLLAVVAVALGLVVAPALTAPAIARADEGQDEGQSAPATTGQDQTDPTPMTQPAPASEVDGTNCSVEPLGEVTVGDEVTAHPDCGSQPEYQWYVEADGALEPIPDQTEQTLSVEGSYVGKVLSVVVNPGEDLTAEASTIGKVQEGTFDTEPVSIKGDRQVGRTLTAEHADWNPKPEYSYQWYQRSWDKKSKKWQKWQAIKDATGENYTLAAAQRDKQVRVVVTGTAEGYADASRNIRTASIKPGVLLNPKPKVTGTTRAGSTLTVKNMRWTKGTNFTYRWYANGKLITKTSSPKYTLKNAQIGKKITVKVTRSKAGYKTVSQTITVTSALRGRLLTKGTPTITGNIAVGSFLRANPGSWTKGTKLKYQWQSCGRNVKGATGRSFKVRNSDLNCRINVKVTGSKYGYATASAKPKEPMMIRWRVATGNQPNLKKYKKLSILIDRKEQRVHIRSNGKTIYTMLTSTGAYGTPTPKGNFRVGDRGPLFMLSNGVGARHWVRITGSILFHSIPIYTSGKYSATMGRKLGQRASAGCVRLSVADSIWFYNSIPRGTPIKVI